MIHFKPKQNKRIHLNKSTCRVHEHLIDEHAQGMSSRVFPFKVMRVTNYETDKTIHQKIRYCTEKLYIGYRRQVASVESKEFVATRASK